MEKSTETVRLTPEVWERIKQLFQTALEKPVEDRSAFLEEACASQTDVLAEVRRLLDAYHPGDTIAPDSPPRRLQKSVMFAGGEVLGGRFRIERLLGVGGMGEVYAATDLVLREAVALKTVRFDVASDERMKSRFAQEVYAARKIAHPNICRIHDLHQHEAAGDLPAITFLTMELISGETLDARLRRTGPMNLEEARVIAEQLTSALMAAHRAGVIHRDFKSANVILTTSPDHAVRAVVTDFGLARNFHLDDRGDSITESGKIIGTLAYMAPEQLLGGSITPGVDIYALGVVLYEIVTGTQPFTGDSKFAIAVKRISNAPPSPKIWRPDLPVEWERAILGCLEPEPQNRTPRAVDVWTTITGETLAPVPAVIEANTRPSPRSRFAWAAILMTLVTLLVAALAGVWLIGRYRPSGAAVRWYEEGTRALRDGTYFTAMNALERAVQSDPDFSLAHARLAEAATELDYMDKAQTEMLRASPPAFQSFFLSSEEKLRLEAIYFVLIKDFEKAAAKYEQLAEKAGSGERPAILVDLGRAYESAGKFPLAQLKYTQSIEQDHQFPAAFLRRAVLEGRQQASEKAAADFDIAEQLYRAEGKAEGLIEVYYQRASLLRRTGRLAEARLPSQKAFDMAQATGDEYHQIRSLLALSQLSYSSGDTDEGQKQAQQAIDLAHRAGIEVLAASGLADIGNALFIKGDNQAAEPYLRNAIESAKHLGALRTEARAQVALGQVLAKEGRAQDALDIIKQASDSYQRLGEKGNAALATIPVARVLRNRGEYEASGTLFRQQLQLAQEAKDEGTVVLAMQGLGTILLLKEQYSAALASFEQSAVVSHAIANQSLEAYSEVYRADTLWRLGRYSEADGHLKVAVAQLSSNKPLMVSIYITRAGSDLSRRSLADTEEDIRKLTETAGPGTPMILVKRILGLVRVSAGRVRDGLALCEESVKLAQSATEIATLKNSELALAEARLASGDRPAALALISSLLPYFTAQNQLESELRALALASSASSGDERPRFLERTKATLVKLKQSLGPENFAGFESRPDIRQIIQRAGLIIDTK